IHKEYRTTVAVMEPACRSPVSSPMSRLYPRDENCGAAPAAPPFFIPDPALCMGLVRDSIIPTAHGAESNVRRSPPVFWAVLVR
ncbi:MAG: hypothetical protein AB7F35_29700, partial [Acetobacteraceae bacterium]